MSTGERENSKDSVKMGTSMSKFIAIFRKNVVTDTPDDNNQRPKAIPGSLGVTLFNVLGLVRAGHHFYRKRRDENGSNIFKVSIYEPRIVLCNYDAFRQIYGSPYVRKEASFGMFVFNYECLGGYTPLIFQNDAIHDKRRKIFIELMKTLFCNESFIENVYNDIEYEMRELARVFECDPNSDFEDALAAAVSNVVTKNIVGKRIDHRLMVAWMENCLIKKFQSARPEASVIYEKIKSEIETSEKILSFCKHVSDNVDDEITNADICNELAFALVFNAYKALSSVVTSCLLHLSNISKEDFNLLKEEATRFHQSSNKAGDMKTLENIDNYVLEIFRLFPPAAFIFRRAKEHFVISLNSGDYQVQKNDLICGNVYLCQRDPDIFDDPDTIDIHRYKAAPKLKDYLTCFGASFSQENVPDIHKCAGQKLALTFAKIFACHSLFIDIEYSTMPTWSGKKIKRIIGTDKPVKVKKLSYMCPNIDINENKTTVVEEIKENELM